MIRERHTTKALSKEESEFYPTTRFESGCPTPFVHGSGIGVEGSIGACITRPTLRYLAIDQKDVASKRGQIEHGEEKSAFSQGQV
jgi:hypothetical protein